MRLFLRFLAAVAVASGLIVSARSARADDLYAVVSKTPELSTLAKLIDAAGLADDLKTAPVLTLLAPTNDAFAKLPKEQTDELLKPENKAKLRAILLYHALAVKFTAADIGGLPVGSKGPSAAGPALTLTSLDPPTINGVAKVIKTDIAADNGVIHEIDTVLLPPAPNKKPVSVTMKASAAEAMTGAATETLAATIARIPELSLFSRFVKNSGLADSLEKRGPLTVFAPTNDALAKAYEALLKGKRVAPRGYEAFLSETDAKVIAILYRHIVAGAYAAADLSGMDGRTLPTVQSGSTLKIAAKDGKVTVNGVPVVRADLAAKNGILHIVADVLPQ